MDNKGQINKIFVYVLSIIMVVFIGYIVIKFIAAFTSDTQDIITNKFFEEIEKDHKTTLTTYGSEKIMTYRVKDDITAICFATSTCNFDNQELNNTLNNISSTAAEEFRLSVENGENILMFDDVGITNTRKIDKFTISNGCTCIKPKQSRIEIIMENKRSDVIFKTQ